MSRDAADHVTLGRFPRKRNLPVRVCACALGGWFVTAENLPLMPAETLIGGTKITTWRARVFCLSSNHVFRSILNEAADISHRAIEQPTARFPCRPRDMRRHNAIARREQRVRIERRFDREHIQPGPRDHAVVQGPRKVPVIHQSAARRVHQQGRLLHSRQSAQMKHALIGGSDGQCRLTTSASARSSSTAAQRKPSSSEDRLYRIVGHDPHAHGRGDVSGLLPIRPIPNTPNVFPANSICGVFQKLQSATGPLPLPDRLAMQANVVA